jgi:hypothetical protein
MVLYLIDPKYSRKPLDLTDTCSKLQNINSAYKTIAFLYTKELTEKEVRKAITFTISSKKDLDINLSRDIKDLYNENNKAAKKEIVEEGMKTSYIHRSAEQILLKWPYYQKRYTNSLQYPSKFQQHSSQKEEKKDPKKSQKEKKIPKKSHGNTKDPK